jgi:hypothetical protein
MPIATITKTTKAHSENISKALSKNISKAEEVKDIIYFLTDLRVSFFFDTARCSFPDIAHVTS